MGVGACISAFALCVAPMSLSAKPLSASLKQIHGTVLIDKGTGYQRASAGTKIKPGHRVLLLENSSAAAVRGDGCVFRLMENTIFSLEPGQQQSCVQGGHLETGTFVAQAIGFEEPATTVTDVPDPGLGALGGFEVEEEPVVEEASVADTVPETEEVTIEEEIVSTEPEEAISSTEEIAAVEAAPKKGLLGSSKTLTLSAVAGGAGLVIGLAGGGGGGGGGGGPSGPQLPLSPE